MKIDADAAGLDPSRLERITDHLERNYIGPRKITGCQTLVARGGHVGYFRSLGSMDHEDSAPIGDDTIFRIYSMTKPITSVALMTLYEQGYFQLGDPVSRFIPEFKDVKVRERVGDGEHSLVDPARPITVRDVLMHTGGLTYGTALENLAKGINAALPWEPGDVHDLATLAVRVAGTPLAFHPGTHWQYSFSTDICARLVEVISGQRFDHYLSSTIFEPLGMVDTGFRLRETDETRFPSCYIRMPDKTLRRTDAPATSSYAVDSPMFSGGGGLISTSADYLRFCQMLLNGGELDGARVLGRKTVELMTQNHLPGGSDLQGLARGTFGETAFEGVGFGLGFAVGLGPAEQAAVGSAGEFYWGGAASTIFWIDPAEELIVIFMTQLIPSATFNFRGQLKNLVYQAIAD